jgi:uncharacterized RDD family membrane protein YckC
MELATLTRRVEAFWIDSIVAKVCAVLVAFLFGMLFGFFGIDVSKGTAGNSLCVAFGFIACILYFLSRDTNIGLGKKWLGLSTVIDSSNDKVTWIQSGARNFYLLIPFVGLIELWIASARVDKKRLGDLLVGTKVVKIK